MNRRETRTRHLPQAIALAALAGTVFSGGASAQADPALSGTWTLNEELSDDAREKMQEAMQGRDTGGRQSGFGGGEISGDHWVMVLRFALRCTPGGSATPCSSAVGAKRTHNYSRS